MKRWTTFLLLAIFLFCISLGAVPAHAEEDAEAEWTILFYFCGSDLESGSAMATKDLQEMAAAKSSEKVDVIVFTGGARQWQNNVVSNQVNQIYRVKDGGLERLVENAGTGAMNDPNTLASFIK